MLSSFRQTSYIIPRCKRIYYFKNGKTSFDQTSLPRNDSKKKNNNTKHCSSTLLPEKYIQRTNYIEKWNIKSFKVISSIPFAQ